MSRFRITAPLLATAATALAFLTPTHADPPTPVDATTLFGGKQSDVAENFVKRGGNQPAAWKVKDGAMTVSGGDIVSKLKFMDHQLHLEFKVPYMPDKTGQARGNSGVFLQGRYEVQVLDSYGLPDPGKGDAGAVYNQGAPLIKAYRKPAEWQTYDIVFRAPRFDPLTNKMTEKARVTVILNGWVTQNNFPIDPTGDPIDNELDRPGPLRLQDHGNAVQYRNIRVIALPAQGTNHY